MRVVTRVDPVQHSLGVTTDDGERGAQLMCDVGKKIAPLRLIHLESAGHGIERLHQAADLSIGAGFYPHGVVAVRYAVRGRHHLGNRSGGVAHRSPDKEEPADHEDQEEESPRRPTAMLAALVAEDRAQDAGGDHQADYHAEETAHLAQESAPTPGALRRRPGLVLRPPGRSRWTLTPSSRKCQRPRRLRRWHRLKRGIEWRQPIRGR